MVHFYFNLLGSILFLVITYSIQYTIGFAFWNLPIDKGGIANLHTLFNVSCTLLFLPFKNFLVKLARLSVPTGEQMEDPLSKLEPRFLKTPSLALEQAQRCVADMGDMARKNYQYAIAPIFGKDIVKEEIFQENESFLDRAEVEITHYLTNMHNIRSVDQRRRMAEIMHSLSDFEKVGDYAQNIFDRLEAFRQEDLTFSESAIKELRVMCNAVSEVLDLTVQGYVKYSVDVSLLVEPLEEVVDTLKERIKSRHLDRLSNNQCTMQTGIPFLDIIHDLEKISDHCSNIAIYTIQLVQGAEEFDTHAYAKQAYHSTPQFQKHLRDFQKKYLQEI